jgi:hypothetical protein
MQSPLSVEEIAFPMIALCVLCALVTLFYAVMMALRETKRPLVNPKEPFTEEASLVIDHVWPLVEKQTDE